MKHSSIHKIIIFFTLILLISCGKGNKIPYPFSKSEYIEVISYGNRMDWDTINGMSKDYYEYSILDKGRIKDFEKNSIEKVRLNKPQEEELYEILYNTNCFSPEVAACYEPRHSFIFYNKDQKRYAAIEVCLKCLGSRETKGVKKIEFCEEKITKLKTFLESIGIKHFD